MGGYCCYSSFLFQEFSYATTGIVYLELLNGCHFGLGGIC